MSWVLFWQIFILVLLCTICGVIVATAMKNGGK